MLDFAASEDGVVMMADGLTPVKRWDGYAAAVTSAGVVAPTDTPVIGSSGSGSLGGTYRAFVRFLDRFGNISNPTPFATEVTFTGKASIDYSNLPVATQSTVVKRQVFRNTDGQMLTFYLDIDTTDLSDTTLSSTKTDAQLAASESQTIKATDGRFLYNRFAPPPDHINVLGFHLNRMFGGGVEDYAEGSVAVTNASNAFTMTGASLTAQMVGRFMHIAGADKPYEIDTINTSAQTGTFTETYGGTTNAYGAYAVRPDPTLVNTVSYSEPNRPEAWPATNAFQVREDGDKVMGLIPFNSFLFIAKRRTLYKLTAESDPSVDGFVYQSVGRGCVNNKCWVIVNEVCYLLDERGIYRFNGRDAEPVSTPIQDLFRGTSKDGLRINWAAARWFHCTADPREEVIRWFVTINGSYLPRWAICFAFNLNRWWLEEYPCWVGASAYGRIGRPTAGWAIAQDQAYLAGRACKVYALGRSPTDEVGWQPGYSGEIVAATLLTITLPGNVGWEVVGAPITIIDGRGREQTRLIAASPGSGLVELDRPLAILPDDGDRFAIGGIGYKFRTHRLELTNSEDRDEFSTLFGFEPQDWGTAAVRRFHDYETEAEVNAADMRPEDGDGVSAKMDETDITIDLTNRGGYAKVRSDRHREDGTPGLRTIRVEVAGVSGPTRHTYTSMRVRGIQK